MVSLSKEILRVINEANVEQYKNMGKVFYYIDAPEQIKNNYIDSFNNWFEKISDKFNSKPVLFAWLLKCVVISLLYRILYSAPYSESENDKSFKKLKDYINSFGYGISLEHLKKSHSEKTIPEFIRPFSYPEEMFSKIEHYYSFSDIKEIQKYNPSNKTPDRVFEDLENILKKHSKAYFLIDERREIEKYGDGFSDFLTFEDGWKWIKKDTSDCRLESKYGGEGHCGRADSDDQKILSLREPSEYPHLYKIWASFSVNEKGFLKQRKGTVEKIDENGNLRRIGNEKPSPITFKYIYDLLMDDRIKGIYKNSGYRNSSDIQIEDFKEDKIKFENLKNKFNSSEAIIKKEHYSVWDASGYSLGYNLSESDLINKCIDSMEKDIKYLQREIDADEEEYNMYYGFMSAYEDLFEVSTYYPEVIIDIMNNCGISVIHNQDNTYSIESYVDIPEETPMGGISERNLKDKCMEYLHTIYNNSELLKRKETYENEIDNLENAMFALGGLVYDDDDDDEYFFPEVLSILRGVGYDARSYYLDDEN